MELNESARVIVVLEDQDPDGFNFDRKVARMLEFSYGYKVLLFNAEDQFLDAIKRPENNVGATLIDHSLKYPGKPVQNGLLVVKKIRSTGTIPKHLPVFVMATSSNYRNEQMAYQNGATGFIAKLEIHAGENGSKPQFIPEGFADRIHAQLEWHGVWNRGAQDRSYRYLIFDSWRFDRYTRRLYDPSNVIVPMSPRGASVLERFLVSPGQVLKPEDFGVNTSRFNDGYLSSVVESRTEMLRAVMENECEAIGKFQNFVGKLSDLVGKPATESSAMKYLASWTVAGPVLDVLVLNNSEQVPSNVQEAIYKSLGREYSDAAVNTLQTSKEEIITGLHHLFCQELHVEEAVNALSCELGSPLTEPLEEFYKSVRERAGKSGPKRQMQLIDTLYDRFILMLFPLLPRFQSGDQPGFTHENLRQRIIPDLRSALGDTQRSQPFIMNVRNQGYRFEAKVKGSNSDFHRDWWAWPWK